MFWNSERNAQRDALPSQDPRCGMFVSPTCPRVPYPNLQKKVTVTPIAKRSRQKWSFMSRPHSLLLYYELIFWFLGVHSECLGSHKNGLLPLNTAKPPTHHPLCFKNLSHSLPNKQYNHDRVVASLLIIEPNNTRRQHYHHHYYLCLPACLLPTDDTAAAVIFEYCKKIHRSIKIFELSCTPARRRYKSIPPCHWILFQLLSATLQLLPWILHYISQG